MLNKYGVKRLAQKQKKEVRRRFCRVLGVTVFFGFVIFSNAQVSNVTSKTRSLVKNQKGSHTKKRTIPLSLVPAKPTSNWRLLWWNERHRKIVKRVQKARPELIMIGDSLVHAWETQGKEVWDKYYKPYHAMNLGFGRDRTEQVLWRIQHGEVDHISPKVVVLLVGTCNTTKGRSINETVAGIEDILQELKKRLPKSRILLLALFPRGRTAKNHFREINDEINRRIASFADQKQIFFLNLSLRFLNKQKFLPTQIMPDSLLLNATGYKIWAEAMAPTLNRLMHLPPLKK